MELLKYLNKLWNLTGSNWYTQLSAATMVACPSEMNDVDGCSTYNMQS